MKQKYMALKQDNPTANTPMIQISLYNEKEAGVKRIWRMWRERGKRELGRVVGQWKERVQGMKEKEEVYACKLTMRMEIKKLNKDIERLRDKKGIDVGC